jgi:hypothetical protein
MMFSWLARVPKILSRWPQAHLLSVLFLETESGRANLLLSQYISFEIGWIAETGIRSHSKHDMWFLEVCGFCLHR